jgi:hypothetical protein
VTREVFEASKGRLKVVGRAGVGIDNVDLAAASETGCLVVNAPTANTVAAAEHGIALLCALARNVPQASLGSAPAAPVALRSQHDRQPRPVNLAARPPLNRVLSQLEAQPLCSPSLPPIPAPTPLSPRLASFFRRLAG